MATPAEAISNWQNKQIDGTQLMRALVSHRRWQIPISEEAAGSMLANAPAKIQCHQNPAGQRALMLWSGEDAYRTYSAAAKVDRQQYFLTTTGAWVFQNALDGVDEIWIDPATAQNITYVKDRFDRLRATAAAVAIEEDIAALRHGTSTDGAIQRVRDYPSYIVGLATGSGGQRLLLAPDKQGRALAAIFTAEDAFEAFLPDAQAQAGSEQLLKIPSKGGDLFPLLARMNLTGIVFNCSGPPTPVAFAAEFAKVAMEG